MSEDSEVTWITVNGAHVPVREGEGRSAAIQRHFRGEQKFKGEKEFMHKVITQTHTQTLTSGEKQVHSKYTPSFQDDRGVWNHGPVFSDRKEALQFGKEHKGKPYEHEISVTYVHKEDRPDE